ncbi:MAG: hypothetical protein K6G42_07220 [Lachnospiraceae bacterium]|nr:hypothetical protein [Lachnospiraceae bacterium]
MISKVRKGLRDPYKLFGLAMILFVVLCYNVLILHNGYRFLNSDDASELALARILASQHKILTKDWIYASELRVLNTNLIFAPMFYLFRSWSMVRAVGGSIMLLIYVASYICIPYAWKYNTRWFYVTAFILIMPFSNPWQFFGLKMYYLPHVFISFVSFAILGLIHNSGKKKRIIIYSAVLAMLAFVAGLGGARSVEYTYAPLLLTALIALVFDKGSLRLVKASAIAAVMSAAGYLVNDRILSGIYSFHSYANVSFIRFTFEKLEWVIDCILTALGYSIGEYFISFGGICNAMSFVMMILFLAAFPMLLKKRKEMSEVQRYMYYFASITFVLNTFLMMVGQNNEYADRFIAIGMVPTMMFIDLVYRMYAEKTDLKALYAVLVMVFFLAIGANGYLNLLKTAGNGERLGYINYLKENGYDYGYATFWNANITTEMSDGAINMTSLDPNAEELVVFYWLTDRRLIEEKHDKAFLVLTSEELDMYEGGEPIYRDEYFSVFDIAEDEISFEEQ